MPNLTALLNAPPPRTFAELDRAFSQPKGTAFRAFKALAPVLVEGRDFHCCDSRLQEARFAEWMASGRFYGGTINAVLLTDSGQAAVMAQLEASLA